MVEATRAAAARIGGSRLITLAGVDHFPQVRVPDLVVQSVRELCRG
jgi:pimeloyl-ACP methyl ester carboxylesterase